ncbi:hypothetical protein [Streptomyces rhizosphaericus]|uniref:hypothetical protein n=1 Tax=Streptomyces rhizosphaericus TaxID=114699 RepID=UPI001ABF563C|nr:hypothetical protein [Streptomyces rhizosphaericus]
MRGDLKNVALAHLAHLQGNLDAVLLKRYGDLGISGIRVERLIRQHFIAVASHQIERSTSDAVPDRLDDAKPVPVYLERIMTDLTDYDGARPR